MNLFRLGQPSTDPSPGGGFNLPDVAPSPPPGLEDFGNDIISWAKWGGGVACVIGAVICIVMMALGRRNRSDMAANGAIGLPWVFAATLLLGGAVSMITGLLNGG